jgi:hypothetical protein
MLVLGLVFAGVDLLLRLIERRFPIWIAFFHPTLVMLSLAFLPEAKDRRFFKEWMTYPLLATVAMLAVHYAGGLSWGFSALISFVGWPLVGTLVTADDDLPGAWSNPDGTIPPPWREGLVGANFDWGLGVSVHCCLGGWTPESRKHSVLTPRNGVCLGCRSAAEAFICVSLSKLFGIGRQHYLA